MGSALVRIQAVQQRAADDRVESVVVTVENGGVGNGERRGHLLGRRPAVNDPRDIRGVLGQEPVPGTV
jgi:hypothetical protein